MKIKTATIAAAFAALLAAAPDAPGRDNFSRPYDNTRHDTGGFDDVSEKYSETDLDRKTTGLLFHRRDPRPAEIQFEEAGQAYLAGRLKEAGRKFDRIVRSHPYSALASRAQYNVGAILERRGKYNAAFEEYRYLLQYYPENANAGTVLEHMFAIANWQLGRGKRDSAVKSFAAIAALAPGWTRTPQSLYLMGEAYAQMREWYEAADAFDTVASDYPDSEYALPALARHAAVLHTLSLKYKEDEAIQNRAITVATSASVALPQDSPARPAVVSALEDLVERRDARAFAIAEFYDRKRYKPESAIAAYEEFLRQYPRSRFAAKAEARLEVLRAAR